MDFEPGKRGWVFTGHDGTDEKDPLYGFTNLRELYLKADPEYTSRVTVPALWDKKKETIVSNESSEIIRMFYSEFDALLPPSRREGAHPNGGLLPAHLKDEIEAMNDWVYNTVNNGVYKTGFAETQSAYEEHLFPLFASLDRLEAHLGQDGHHPYLFGEHITEADVRLYTTIVRFDPAYYLIFRCNIRMIRHDYPRLQAWLLGLYWDMGERTNKGAFHNTTYIPLIKAGYSRQVGLPSVPFGPVPDVLPLKGVS